MRFIAITLYMGINKLPNMKLYSESSRLDSVLNMKNQFIQGFPFNFDHFSFNFVVSKNNKKFSILFRHFLIQFRPFKNNNKFQNI